MKTTTICGASLVLILSVWQLRSQEPQPAKVLPSIQLPTAEQEKQPDKDKKQPDTDKKQPDKDNKEPEKKANLEPSQTNVFAPGTNNLGQVLPQFTPNMIGWVPPIGFAAQTIPFTGLQTTTTTGRQVDSLGTITTVTKVMQTVVTQPRTVLVPEITRGPFAIAENESPMPQDRVFVTYNNYSSVIGPVSGFNAPSVTTQTMMRNTPLGPTTSTVTTVLPGAPSATVNQEVIGFEKSFLDGHASVEVRMPFLEQSSGFSGFSAYDTGDVTIVGKYAFYMDRSTGNAISGGLAVTAPTGAAIVSTQGNLRDTLLQPFVAYVWNFDRFFVQAFHSIAVPTDASDVTILFNDVGLGYRLYQGDPNRFLNSIAPVVEAHVDTPLNHRGAVNDPFFVPDIVGITAGVQFGIFRNATLSVGATTPVTAPRVYSVEGFVQMNWRF
jgi:hypothetical protein